MLSPSGLIAGVRRRLRDTAGTNALFSDREILDALTDAVQGGREAFWADAVYDSLTLGVNQRDYVLPPYVKRVRKVERELINYPSGTASDYAHWQTMRRWQHVPGQQTNYLIIDTPSFENERVRVYYEADLPVTMFQATNATSVISTARFIAYSSGDVPIWEWPVPGYLRVGDEVMYYEAVQYSPQGFTSVQRGVLGTGPGTATMAFGLAHASKNIIEPVWVQDFAQGLAFLQQQAMQFLYLQRLNTGDTEGNRNVAALAAEWGRIAAAEKASSRQRHLPRTLRTQRQGR